MNRNLFRLVNLVILTLAFYTPTFADTTATQCSYSISSGNGKYIFVMLATEKFNECLSQGDKAKAESEILHKEYKSSGLYQKSNSTKPLWTVEWYSYKVYLSADGKYFVRTGPWASKETDEAFSFFSDGKLVKSYLVNDLIRFVSALPHSVSHFQWEKQSQLNDSNNSFEVITLEDGKFIFNLENGEIISQSKPILPTTDALTEPRFYIVNWLMILGIVILISGLTLIIYRKYIRSKS